MKPEIEHVFVTKQHLTDTDRAKAAFDKYLHGDITQTELNKYLRILRPKQLKHQSELRGYA